MFKVPKNTFKSIDLTGIIWFKIFPSLNVCFSTKYSNLNSFVQQSNNYIIS